MAQIVQVILDRSQELQAAASGFARSTGDKANTPDHAGRYNKKINFHEFIAEHSEAAGAEIAGWTGLGCHLEQRRPALPVGPGQARGAGADPAG